MDRRDFLKSALQAAVALGVARAVPRREPSAEPAHPERRDSVPPPSPADVGPEFVAFGSPYRKSADPFAAPGGRRERAAWKEETLHLRMPPEWRDRLILGIRS
jgi:hypothetical protein